MTTRSIPNLQIIVAVCGVAVAGYAAFSVWTVWRDQDAALIGDIIGTWKSFAVMAFGFWLGSSSGGKARDAEHRPTGTPVDPVSVEEVKP